MDVVAMVRPFSEAGVAARECVVGSKYQRTSIEQFTVARKAGRGPA
jgi:hypothetical protein